MRSRIPGIRGKLIDRLRTETVQTIVPMVPPAELPMPIKTEADPLDHDEDGRKGGAKSSKAELLAEATRLGLQPNSRWTIKRLQTEIAALRG